MNEAPATSRVSDAAMAHLRAADPVLAGLIDRFGGLEFSIDPDLWRAVVGSIVGQQLSVAAARTIRSRIAALGGDHHPTPAQIVGISDETLRGCGLSRAKVSYVRDAARAWLDGDVRPDEIATLADEDVIEKLTSVRGVGRWTAQMVLIFCLDRHDVLAVDDLGIRAAVQRSYGLAERPGAQELTTLAEEWRPYRSHASRYLWRSLQG